MAGRTDTQQLYIENRKLGNPGRTIGGEFGTNTPEQLGAGEFAQAIKVTGIVCRLQTKVLHPGFTNKATGIKISRDPLTAGSRVSRACGGSDHRYFMAIADCSFGQKVVLRHHGLLAYTGIH